MPITITKSKFVAGCQCLKRLYLLVHSPELGRGKTDADFALMNAGREVGKLAQRLFAGGIEVRAGDRDEALCITQELIANPDIPAIFEGAFEREGILVRVDILHRRKDGRWRLIEVKSSTSMKEGHSEDAAVQYHVVSKCGVDVASCHLATVNRQYVFPGGKIDPWRFFRIRNLTRKVKNSLPKLTFQLRSEFRILAMPTAPDLPTGKHCVQPIICEFYDHCNPPRPDDHIAYLPYLHANTVEELEEMGVKSVRDIPDDYPLGDRQRRAATCVQSGDPWFSPELPSELAKLEYPVYFLDFETVNPAIPRFAGMRPYDHLPFQWSLLVQRDPEAELEHYEYLAESGADPRRDFISSLCNVLGESGTIVVCSSFEFQRLSELASWFPEFADRINAIKNRLFDLLPVVRGHTYHPAYAGSYSIKSVLPALVPEIAYDCMEVANGQDAGLAWESLVRGGLDSGERDRIGKALLDYCALDTLAMVRLLDKLKPRTHGENRR